MPMHTELRLWWFREISSMILQNNKFLKIPPNTGGIFYLSTDSSEIPTSCLIKNFFESWSRIGIIKTYSDIFSERDSLTICFVKFSDILIYPTLQSNRIEKHIVHIPFDSFWISFFWIEGQYLTIWFQYICIICHNSSRRITGTNSNNPTMTREKFFCLTRKTLYSKLQKTPIGTMSIESMWLRTEKIFCIDRMNGLDFFTLHICEIRWVLKSNATFIFHKHFMRS